LEKAPAEILPESEKVRRTGKESGECNEVYLGSLQPGKGTTGEKRVEAEPGKRGSLGVGERGVASPEERGAGEGVRPEERGERRPPEPAEIERPTEANPDSRNFQKVRPQLRITR
jgi:hypothetical protein